MSTNDAIPSWSGYNYQGKATLLYILEKINILNRIGEDVSQYSVELELNEDFVIKKNGVPESFHQVKAMLTKNSISAYKGAIEKLIEAKDKPGSTDAKGYLMVASCINNWEKVTNIYQSHVTLYKYEGMIVDVITVSDFIILELEKYLEYKQLNAVNKNAIYGELCIFLDQKIAAMHTQLPSERDYAISFIDFENIIYNNIQKDTVSKNHELKEKVYLHVTNGIKEGLEKVCKGVCDKLLSDCEEDCAAMVACEKILDLPDLLEYCKVINPSKLDGWDKDINMAVCFPPAGMEQNIFLLFKISRIHGNVNANEHSVFLYTEHAPGCEYVIPTLLDLSNFSNYGKKALQDTFQNIKDNTDIIDILDGNGITATYAYSSTSLSQENITSIWKNHSKNDSKNDDNDIMKKFNKSIEIISRSTLIDKFNNTGENDA